MTSYYPGTASPSLASSFFAFSAYAYQSLLETYWIIMDKGLRVAELPGTTEVVDAGTGVLMGRQGDLNSR